MASLEERNPEPPLRFKRRKILHPKRARLDDEAIPTITSSQSSDAANIVAASTEPPHEGDGDPSPKLQEIMRNRKRPRDRFREAVRRAETTRLAQPQSPPLGQMEGPKQETYANKFVAQTGQVVDRDDKQMTEYIEARLAEKNHRLYGWPIPKHLETAVAVVTAESEQSAATARTNVSRTATAAMATDQGLTVRADQSHRLAAGMGKLHEVDLGPDAISRNLQRTKEAWKKLEGVQIGKEPVGKVRLGRDGKPRRPPKRRNSEDLRRDQMVEALLREAKLDYFEEDKPSSTSIAGDADNDDAMVEKFRLDFLESVESRQQRKPAPPPSIRGAKEAPKGPKLGGSRSARAAMRLQEEQAAKGKR